MEQVVFVLSPALVGHLLVDVPVGQSLEQQVGSQLLTLVTSHVGLCRLHLAEAQTRQLTRTPLTRTMAASSSAVTTNYGSLPSSSTPSKYSP